MTRKSNAQLSILLQALVASFILIDAQITFTQQRTSDSSVATTMNSVFRGPAVYESGGFLAQKVAVADLNRDGTPDLVAVNYSKSFGSHTGSVGVLLGKGDGTFLPAAIYDSRGGGPTAIVIGDLNGDGKPDLVVGNHGCPGLGSHCVGVLLGNGDGTFQPVMIYARGGVAGMSNPIMLADVNLDGKADVLVVNETDHNYGDGSLGILLGNGDGTLRPVVLYDSGGFGAYSGVLADINGDSNVDVILVNCTISRSTDCLANQAIVGVLLGKGDGTFQSVKKYGTGGVGGWFDRPVVVVDVSSDGKPDILVGNGCTANSCRIGSLGVLLGNGDGTFQPSVTYNDGGAIGSIAVGDVNADGKVDVAVASDSGLGTFLGNGNGTFRSLSIKGGVGQGPSQIFLSDLNHDGTLDLLGASATGSSATVLLGNGDDNFQPAQEYKLGGEQISWATLADADGDGKPDLVATNWEGLPNSGLHGVIGVLRNISKSATATTLSSTLNPSIYGQKVVFSAKVKTDGKLPPTGTVVFKWKYYTTTYAIGTATLTSAGLATLTKSNLNADPYPVIAIYRGDTNNLSSTSSVLNQTVLQTTSVATLTSSLNPATVGQAITFTAKITSPTVIPSGPVTFKVGTTVLGTAQLSGGKAMFMTSTLPAGSTVVKVTYNGNSNVKGSSASITQTVQR
jgi:Big-like domain-containing protein/VCBS repeat protein